MLLGDGMDRRSLTHEILSQLPLAQQTTAWGTLGTIKSYLGFDAESDLQHLVEAILGPGARPLLGLSCSDRSGALFQDLLKSMEAALSGNLERVIMGLLKPLAQYDAHELRVAILRPSFVSVIYHTATQGPLVAECCNCEQTYCYVGCGVRDTTSDHVTNLSLRPSTLQGKREHYTGIIDYALIQQDAEVSLGMCPSWEWGREPGLTLPSPTPVVFGQYRKSHGLEVEETICKRFQGDGQVAMLALASVCRNTPRYFTERLHNGPGTDVKVLTRILISCSETDLLSIRSEFRKRHGKSLYSCLQVSIGDYQAALLALCRAEDL
uniref:Annexin A9 n=1 Tax=Chelonoidis abingdonii TaxID=106734 RepID=A0A8C0GQZ3_CHEAB